LSFLNVHLPIGFLLLIDVYVFKHKKPTNIPEGTCPIVDDIPALAIPALAIPLDGGDEDKIFVVDAPKVEESIADKQLWYLSVGENQQLKNTLDSYEWLNGSIHKIWQSQRAGVEDSLLHICWPQFKEKLKDLPINVDLDLYSLGLGSIAPKFEKISIIDDKGETLIMDLDIDFPSEANIMVKVKTDVIPRVTLEVASINIFLEIRVILRGMSSTPPFIQGLEVCLKRPPVLQWSLGAMAKMANLSFIDRAIKDTIQDNIKMIGNC